jgi:cyclase
MQTDSPTIARRDFCLWVGLAMAAPALAGRARGLRPGTYFPWTEVGEGLRVVVDAATGGNVLVMTRPDAGLLIDTKYPALGPALVREAEAFGHRLTHAINTHHHGDHTGGNAPVKARAGEFLAHANAVERIAAQVGRFAQMAAGGGRQVDMQRDGAETVLEEAQAEAQAASDWSAEDFTPTRGLSAERTALEIGGEPVVVHHFGPGHTDNDLVIQFPEADLLHVGDLCFKGLHPFFDPDGGVTCRGWSRVLERVIDLCEAGTVVVPGHGELTDAEGLRAQKRYLDALWEEVSRAVEAGEPKDEVVQKSWPFMEGLGFEQIRSRAIGAVYDEVSGG